MFVNVIRGSTSLTVLSLLLSLMQADEDRDSGTESDEEIDDPDLPSAEGSFRENMAPQWRPRR
jgi:hypothetical protein